VSADPAFREPFLSKRKALTNCANDVSRRNPHVVKNDLPRSIPHHCGPLAFQDDTRALHVHYETGDAPAGPFFRVGYSHHLSIIGAAGPGDETLVSVEDKMIPVTDRARLHARWITSGTWLGLGKTDPLLSPYDRKEEAFFLFLIGVEEDCSHFRTEQLASTERKSHRAPDLLRNNAAREEVKASPAVLLRDIQQPKPHGLYFLLEGTQKVLWHLCSLRAELLLEGNQLFVDKASQASLKHPELFR
jgi:hypothetical protein